MHPRLIFAINPHAQFGKKLCNAKNAPVTEVKGLFSKLIKFIALFMIRQDLRFVNRMYNLYNYTSRVDNCPIQQKQHIEGCALKIRKPRGILCTRGEKEHTSKRVSVIDPDNVISKAKLTGTPRDTVYSRGKGINKQKTNKQIKCVCLVKSAVTGDPKRYFVLLGKRSTQAKE